MRNIYFVLPLGEMHSLILQWETWLLLADGYFSFPEQYKEAHISFYRLGRGTTSLGAYEIEKPVLLPAMRRLYLVFLFQKM